MPVIQITLLEGRTAQQKRRMAERITEVVVEEAGAARDGVVVTFVDVPFDSYARGGLLMQDQREKKTIKT